MPSPCRIFASPPLRDMFLAPCLCLTLCLCLCLIVGCREDTAAPPTPSPSSSAATSGSAAAADSTARSISRPAERSIALGVVPAEERTVAGFDSAQSAGVFVGIRKFSKDEELTEVMFAVDDAVDFAHLCVFTLDLIKPARAVLCLSGDPQKSESAKRLAALRQAGAQILDADQSTIYKVLQEQRKASGPAGLLVVHAATHGFSDQGTDYLVAADTFRGRIVRTGIAVSEVFDEVGQARTPRRLVLLDACRERLTKDSRAGGASAASPMGRAFSEAIAASAGQVVLAGTVQGGYSFDDVKRQNGVFTAAAMDALSGQAQPDSRGFITAGELATFVNDRVMQWVKENKHDHAATCTGIEKKIAGDGARLPLAISPRAFEGYKAYVERRKKAQATLKSLMDFETLTAERVQEVCKALDGADPSAGGPTVEKIELLGRKLPEYGPADFAKWWDAEGRKALVPATPTPRPTPEPTPAKSETAAWEALGKLEALAKEAALDRRIAMYDSFVGEWSGTKAAADAQQQIARLRELETLAAEAVKAYAALESRESAEVLTKSQADLRRAAWDDYLAKYAATEHQVAEARQRRDHWAAWTPVTPTPKGPEKGKPLVLDLGGGVTMEFVWIPPGSFEMGSPDSEKDHQSDESPLHTVDLDGFWMGKYEVTNAQYRRFKPDHSSGKYEGLDLDGATQPVVNVSWNDAVAFCDWLGNRPEAKSARIAIQLPTEAQWEYACRAGSPASRYWGSSETEMGKYANVADRTAKAKWSGWTIADTTDGYAVSAPVGQFEPNKFGLHDMIGNVWEWCSDWYDSGYYGKSPRKNPTGPSSGSYRVARGGSWRSGPRDCRSAPRNISSPEYRGDYLGFRADAER